MTILLCYNDKNEDDTYIGETIEVEDYAATASHLYFATKEKTFLVPWHVLRRVEVPREEKKR